MNVPSTKATFFRFQPTRPSQPYPAETMISSQHSSQSLRQPMPFNEPASVSGQDPMRALRQDFLSTINTFMQSTQTNTGRIIETLKIAGSQQQDELQVNLRALHEEMRTMDSAAFQQFETQREQLRASLNELKSFTENSSARILQQAKQNSGATFCKKRKYPSEESVAAKRFKPM
jgi:hypothetical protein